MPVESKPLFHPEVIRQRLLHFGLPPSVEECRPRLRHWADLIASDRADALKETDLLPDFITDIFVNLLGYTRPAQAPECHTLSRETQVVVDGQKVDAVLGRFRPDGQEYVVALEGKGTRDPLEIPFGGRRMSAVDRCYRYAINLPAEVKNIRGRKLPLTAAGLQALRQEYTNTIDPARHHAAEALALEQQLNTLVNQAYALTPEETALLWTTAPPRMPIPPAAKEPEPA